MVLIFSMFSVRIGQLMSVATHWASCKPQVQAQRSRLAAWRTLFFAFESSDEKSTTAMARSS
jgi:hypothetical protein